MELAAPLNKKAATTELMRFPARLVTERPVIATLGNFDGIHIGHQSLLSAVGQRASSMSKQGEEAAVRVLVSFYPHPAVVLGKSPGIPRITTLAQNIGVLSSFGIDKLYMVHFTRQLSELRAKSFMDEILIDKLGITHMILGPDASVGHNREGSSDFIVSYLASCGRSAEILPFVEGDDDRVSSRRIRSLIAAGDLDAASRLLGRRFALEGRIVAGAGRGRTIGIPTANIHVRDQILPPNGVYATRARFDGREHLSVTNIGVRPTFGGTRLAVETHILDMPERSLYGRRLELDLLSLVRPERKFDSPAELVSQIRADIESVRKRFR